MHVCPPYCLKYRGIWNYLERQNKFAYHWEMFFTCSIASGEKNDRIAVQERKLQRKEKIHCEQFFSFGCIFYEYADSAMCWKFSLVCALALYMLNQSKLYLGRHVCLSICLWFCRNSYLSGDTMFNEDMRQRLQARPFLFWL